MNRLESCFRGKDTTLAAIPSSCIGRVLITDHLNYFEPYQSKDAHHEDQLTRAFVVILRHVPLAHAAWLGLVDRAHREKGGEGVPLMQELPEPVFAIQRGDLPEDVSRVVSVIQTDDHYFDDRRVGRSKRSQVLDGVICYPPDLAVVIENKPSVGNVSFKQLSINVPEETSHDERFANVSWREILEILGNLASTSQVTGTEGKLLGDFLSFVERQFPKIQPFSRLRLCGDNIYRIKRRCRAILEEITPGHVQYHKGWSWYINLGRRQPARMAAFKPREVETGVSLELMFAPGGTMTQARRLYKSITKGSVEQLVADGWTVEPDFHLSFMATNLQWTTVTIDLGDYVNYWRKNRKKIMQVKRGHFAEYFDWLISQGFATEGDRPKFVKEFINTRRPTMNVCPGLAVIRSWELEEASALDDSDSFVPAVRAAIVTALKAWNGSLPFPAGDNDLGGSVASNEG